MRHVVQVTEKRFGRLSAVVNCAGVGIAKRTLTKKGPHPLEDFQRVMNVNAIGTFNVIRLASEVMAKCEPYCKSGERGVCPCHNAAN